MDIDLPIHFASDVAKLIEYSDGNAWKMLEMCEADEKLTLPMVVHGQRRAGGVIFADSFFLLPSIRADTAPAPHRRRPP